MRSRPGAGELDGCGAFRAILAAHAPRHLGCCLPAHGLGAPEDLRHRLPGALLRRELRDRHSLSTRSHVDNAPEDAQKARKTKKIEEQQLKRGSKRRL